MPSEEFVFDVLDFKGRRVRLTRRTFENHLPIHPEISEYLEEAKQVISDPDGALELDNGAVVVFRYGLDEPNLLSCSDTDSDEPNLKVVTLVWWSITELKKKVKRAS